MRNHELDRTLAVGVAAVAAFNTLAALSHPVPARKPGLLLVVACLALLVAHATLYWLGPGMRQRLGLRAYVSSQAALVFAFGLSGVLFPVGIGLYVALTAQVVLLAGPTWSTLPITLGAILLFAVNAMIAADLYRGATAGLLLATTGVVAHAIAALKPRLALGGTSPADPITEATPTITQVATSLTPREREVLRAIAAGERSSQIAAELGITERTVKAHLASIYRKLGVDSRAAAVAIAVRGGLT